MNLTNCLPTVFAQHMAGGVDLFFFGNEDDTVEKMREYEERLIMFQQMSATADFKTSLTAYLGVELEDEQKTVLKIIHETTKPWLMAHVFGTLLNRINTKADSGKDFAEVTKILLETFAKNGEIDDKVKRGLLVRFANIPAGEAPVSIEKVTDDE